MKVGTKSLLFGVHQFIWHPITVALAWRKLYGKWPRWEEAVCIFCHDLGYWGLPNMDGPEGKDHPIRGALLAARFIRFVYRLAGNGELKARTRALFYFEQTLCHSKYFADTMQMQASRFYYADKASVLHDPRWFYLLRAKASGEVWEYIDVALRSKVWSYEWSLFFATQPRDRKARLWLNWYREKTRLRISKI